VDKGPESPKCRGGKNCPAWEKRPQKSRWGKGRENAEKVLRGIKRKCEPFAPASTRVYKRESSGGWKKTSYKGSQKRELEVVQLIQKLPQIVRVKRGGGRAKKKVLDKRKPPLGKTREKEECAKPRSR